MMSGRPIWQPVARSNNDKPAPVEGAYTDADVLTGRDSMALLHPGNKFFRTLIHMHRPAYLSARKRHTKTDIINAIISTVWENGGRFLTLESASDDGNSGPAVWTEMESYEIHHKVSHALRAVKNRASGTTEKKPSPVTSSIDASAAEEKTEPCSSTASSRSPSTAPSPPTSMELIGKDVAAAAAEAKASTSEPHSATDPSLATGDAELATRTLLSIATSHHHHDMSSQGLLAPRSHDDDVSSSFHEGWTTDQWRQLVANEMHRRSMVRSAASRYYPSVITGPSWTSVTASSSPARSCPELTSRTTGTSIAVTASAMSSSGPPIWTDRRMTRLSLPLPSPYDARGAALPAWLPLPRHVRCNSAPPSVLRLQHDMDSEDDGDADEGSTAINETRGVGGPHGTTATTEAVPTRPAPTAAPTVDTEPSTASSSHSFFTLDGKRAEL